jgi:hypothetical protein
MRSGSHTNTADLTGSLHALDRHALGELVEHLGQRRMFLRQLPRPRPDLVGQQQLTAGRREQPVLGRLQ